MKKYRIGVIGLKMGHAWARAAADLQNTELAIAYDKFFWENEAIDHDYYKAGKIRLAADEEEVYGPDTDIVIVATPDHLHAEQCVKALAAGKHVICEKPLASSVEECRRIIAAVEKHKRFFMVGQVCRYAPGFKTAKHLIESGRIGEMTYIESEYAHDYSVCPGFNNWRKDPKIGRQGFLGGGCHALDITRWLAGDPSEVFCYMNHKHLPDWPTNDTGVAVAKFPKDVIGRVFVSIGVKRPYTMRTVINGTNGTIICDNTSDHLMISEEGVCDISGKLEFSRIPVKVSNHNVQDELKDFIGHLDRGEQCATDVYQGTKTVAFAMAAIESAEKGIPVKLSYRGIEG